MWAMPIPVSYTHLDVYKRQTLLRMIAGFNTIEGGDFYFNDQKINDLAPEKRNIGMVFQNYAIFPHLTVKKNVACLLYTSRCV